MHEPACEFRPVPCQFCRRAISYRHLKVHEHHCHERKTQCGRCGLMVFDRRLPEHETEHCTKGYEGIEEHIKITLKLVLFSLCVLLGLRV